MAGAGAATVVGAKNSTAEECKAILKAGEVQEPTCAEHWLEMEQRSAVTGIWDFG